MKTDIFDDTKLDIVKEVYAVVESDDVVQGGVYGEEKKLEVIPAVKMDTDEEFFYRLVLKRYEINVRLGTFSYEEIW